MSEQSGERLLHAGAEVSFADIESALRRSSNDESKHVSGMALTATVVVAGPPPRLVEAAQALSELIDAGLRAVLISYGDNPSPRVHVSRQTVSLEGLRPEYLNNAVAALRLSSLPTAVWWRGGQVEALTGLAALSDRLVLDAEDPREVWSLVDNLAERTAVSDLRWTRLTRWRALMAQFFDIADIRAAAAAFRVLRIEGSDRHAARLYAGWLASTLHWDRSVVPDLREIPGAPPLAPGDTPRLQLNVTDAYYFQTMGIPLLRGRVLNDQDGPATPRVVVINRRMAERYWPDQDPVGRTLHFPDTRNPLTATIVGVVGDVKHYGLSEPDAMQAYAFQAQLPHIFNSLIVRTAGDPVAKTNAVRQAVWSVDPQQPAKVKAEPGEHFITEIITTEAAEDPAFLDAMNAARIKGALLGVESVTDEGLKTVYKDFSAGGDELVRRLLTFRRHGVHVLGSFIFGLPSDREATFAATLSVAERANLTFAQFVMLTPFPGTLDFAAWEKSLGEAPPNVNGVPISQARMEYVVKSQLQQGQVNLTLDLAPDLPTAFADGNQIQQVVLNLLLNAQQAIENGGQLVADTSGGGSPTRSFLLHLQLRCHRDLQSVQKFRFYPPGISSARPRVDRASFAGPGLFQCLQTGRSRFAGNICGHRHPSGERLRPIQPQEQGSRQSGHSDDQPP
jgi:hypothetical protein